ncbi:MAG: hypothetical protein C0594_06100 [Marinilabiliales bacterium]|nr:MAG: hypothetical protein C0594_06100 [Marinilabiliales bacterium]
MKNIVLYRVRLYVTLALLNIGYNVDAQDIHFSMFNESPMLTNPASTGDFVGDHRVIMNYRQQWAAVAIPYTTYAFHYDGNYFRNNRTKENRLGIGVTGYSDKAGDSEMGVSQLLLNLSYFKQLKQKHVVSVGFQGGVSQRSIAYEKLTWGNQYDGSGYNSQLDPMEPIPNQSFMYGDVACGLNWRYEQNRFLKTQLGVSMYHLNPIQMEYVSGFEEQLDRNITVHGGLEYMVKNTSTSFLPGFLYRRQGKASELLFGGLIKYQLPENGRYNGNIMEQYIAMGSYYRWKDAFVLAFIYSYKNVKMVFSYDVNDSGISAVSNGRGAFELTLAYHTPYQRRYSGSSLL